MQAIETKYLGPTNTKGARIKASAWADSVTIPFEYGGWAGTDGAHDLAVIALVNKLEWWGVWARGGKANCEGNVYVCISRSHDIRTPHPQVTNPLDYIVVLPPEEPKP